MPQYVAWLKALPGQPVFVAYPARYDFLFVYWYLMRFARELKAEARFVRLLEGLDAADFDYEAARNFWQFDGDDDPSTGDDWVI